MCGLFGILTRKPSLSIDDIKLFVGIGWLSALRGKHSTGMFAVDTDGNHAIYKSTLPSTEFFDLSPVKKMLEGKNLKCLSGHARYATKGAIVTANAHPFEFESVIGMHNGTLFPMCVEQYTNKDTKYDTDSEGIFAAINAATQENVNGYEEVVPKLEGAYALVSWDIVNKNINFIRNKDRNLYFMESGDGTTTFWASDYRFLEFVASYQEYDVKLAKGYYDAKLLDTDILYTLPLLCNTAKWSKLKLESTQKYSYQYVSTYSRSSGSSSTYYGRSNQVVPFRGTATPLLPDNSKPTTEVNVKLSEVLAQFKPSLHGNNKVLLAEDGQIITEQDWAFIPSVSCALCRGSIIFDEGALIAEYDAVGGNMEALCVPCLEESPEIIDLVRRIAK